MKYRYDVPMIAVEDFERPVRLKPSMRVRLAALRNRLFDPLGTYLAAGLFMLCLLGMIALLHFTCDATDCGPVAGYVAAGR